MSWNSKKMTSTFFTHFPLPHPREQIKEKTKDDPALRDLTSTVLNGWPADKASALPGARPYWNFQDEITSHHGILFKGARIVIPIGDVANHT